MDAVRLFRTLLGLAIFLASAYLFEPSLFGAKLPTDLMANETLRNLVGVAGAVAGVLVMIDALFPKPKPAEPLCETAPAPPRPEPVPLAPVPALDLPETPPVAANADEPPAAEPEPAWGAYVEPDEDTVKAAQALVEGEYAQAVTTERETGPEADAAAEPEGPPAEVGRGLPPPPPKPE